MVVAAGSETPTATAGANRPSPRARPGRAPCGCREVGSTTSRVAPSHQVRNDHSSSISRGDGNVSWAGAARRAPGAGEGPVRFGATPPGPRHGTTAGVGPPILRAVADALLVPRERTAEMLPESGVRPRAQRVWCMHPSSIATARHYPLRTASSLTCGLETSGPRSGRRHVQFQSCDLLTTLPCCWSRQRRSLRCPAGGDSGSTLHSIGALADAARDAESLLAQLRDDQLICRLAERVSSGVASSTRCITTRQVPPRNAPRWYAPRPRRGRAPLVPEPCTAPAAANE